ncbi:MAG: sensor domain-containing diguanylate cyclase [Sedimenticola sp.]|nr:sensor domain-containing diguanylate cyclase [Sedimenticola sp.]
MSEIKRLRTLVGLEENDIALIREYQDVISIELANRIKDYEAWFHQSADWPQESSPFIDDYLPSFYSADYSDHFFSVQYQQASHWRKRALDSGTAIASLTQLRDIFINIGGDLMDHQLSRSLCRVVDLAQSIQAVVHHLDHVLVRHQQSSEQEIKRASRMFNQLSPADQDGILNAYIEHYRWKLKAYRLALGDTPDEIALPLSKHECTLGRWLDSGGMDELPTQFQTALDIAHTRLHKLAAMAVDDVNAGKPHAVTEYLLDLEAASEEITSILYDNLTTRLNVMAIEDTLTRLPNRRQFDRDIDQKMAYAKRNQTNLGLLVIDIDHFKRINDEYGHTVGDEFLKELKGRLTHAIRSADNVYRWGGEEFTALVWPSDKDELGMIAERLREGVMKEPLMTSMGTLTATVSIGAVLYDPEIHQTADDLFRVADHNLQTAKQSGRNKVVLI